MGLDSGIEWCDHTLNLWWGCTQVENHPGCDHCYALDWDKRYGGSHWGNKNKRREIGTYAKILRRIDSIGKNSGELQRVFVGSMMDIFEPNKPTDRGSFTSVIRTDFFKRLEAGEWPNILFQFLTKRPKLISRLLPEHWYSDCPPNLWFGTSISTSKELQYVEWLIENTPSGSKRFLSIEPLLGPISIIDASTAEEHDGEWVNKIEWIIAGGESGPHARPTHPDWIHFLQQDCEGMGIPFFFKQWGEYAPTRSDDKVDIILDPDGNAVELDDYEPIWGHEPMTRYGKKEAGRLLNNQTYDEFPKEMQREKLAS